MSWIILLLVFSAIFGKDLFGQPLGYVVDGVLILVAIAPRMVVAVMIGRASGWGRR
ncbi:hypothetical protein [Leekyejoonella antrihumi]|uniref:hypothetical protein n=1 Tax=Leekyejoonella antrihumi TaxID=1660198 RepID=UPI001645741D|nr:hypothetical protein [Leekyejoonella antrihumi]